MHTRLFYWHKLDKCVCHLKGVWFILIANSVNSDPMLCFSESDLGLQSLPRYLL